MKRKRPVLRIIWLALVAALDAKFLWDTEVSLVKLERGLPWMADFSCACSRLILAS
jgi:hypothetical protein